MRPRYTVRLAVTLVMAVCVLIAFSGSVSAQEVISINEEDTDALVDVDGSGGAGSSGGGGGGSVDVGNDQANGGGGAEVEVSPDGGTVDVGGGGAAGDREVSGGVECTFTAAPEAPDCEPETPGDGGGSVPQVDTDHDSSLGPDGGSGEGSVEVTSEQGDFDGDAEVAGSPDEGAYLLVEGEGSAQDQVVGGGVECDIPAGQPDDPSTVCQPAGDNGGVPSLPSPPGDGIPSPPGDGLPDLPSVPSPPGDEIPSPGDGLPDVPSVPSPPGGGIPISGLQSL